jgi:hypothetical protein
MHYDKEIRAQVRGIGDLKIRITNGFGISISFYSGPRIAWSMYVVSKAEALQFFKFVWDSIKSEQEGVSTLNLGVDPNPPYEFEFDNVINSLYVNYPKEIDGVKGFVTVNIYGIDLGEEWRKACIEAMRETEWSIFHELILDMEKLPEVKNA